MPDGARVSFVATLKGSCVPPRRDLGFSISQSPRNRLYYPPDDHVAMVEGMSGKPGLAKAFGIRLASTPLNLHITLL